MKGKGIVSNEPSVVAVSKGPGGQQKVVAVGKEAKEMLGRTPGSITAVRPMKDGVIADFEITGAMLRHFIGKAHNRSSFIRPRIMICIPFGVTEVEKTCGEGICECSRRPRSIFDRRTHGCSNWSGAFRLLNRLWEHDCRYRRRHNRSRP